MVFYRVANGQVHSGATWCYGTILIILRALYLVKRELGLGLDLDMKRLEFGQKIPTAGVIWTHAA